MAARANKSTPTKSAKTKSKDVKKAKKLPGFFRPKTQKFVLLVAVVVGFAAGGSYWLYSESSARVAKDLTTVQGCMDSGVVLRRNSSGSCVRVVQRILNAAKYRYGSAAHWGYLEEDAQYGPATALTVAAYQQFINGFPQYPDTKPVADDGVVGRVTWMWLRNIACVDISTKVPACGD